MRSITQFRCSSVLRYDGYRPDHCGRFRAITGLNPYKRKELGTLFFGCYGPPDIKRINNHTGEKVIYWAGSDITYAREGKWKFDKDIIHATGTEVAKKELSIIGINALVRPIAEVDPKKLKLCKMGDSVFVYMPWKRCGFYGFHMIREVAKRLPDVNFIITRYGPKDKYFKNSEIHPLVKFDELVKIYERCFCSIRPTEHDGLSQCLLELALCGRVTAHPHVNGWGFKCNTVDQYVDFIRKEMERNKPHEEEREKVLKIVNNFDFLE